MEDAALHLGLRQLRECIRTRDDGKVENVLMELNLVTLKMDRWPNDFFDGLEQLMKDQGFLSLGKSWNLFYFLNNNWEQIPEPKKESLRQTFAAAFDNCGDWMGAFVIGEILGERYADETTLAILAGLAKTEHLHWIELVPHALETLARNTGDSALHGLVVVRLEELRKHESEHVRDEAAVSLAKLGLRT
jgi:hypothetical protein